MGVFEAEIFYQVSESKYQNASKVWLALHPKEKAQRTRLDLKFIESSLLSSATTPSPPPGRCLSSVHQAGVHAGGYRAHYCSLEVVAKVPEGHR